MVARQKAHDFAAFGINADVRAKRVHHVDRFGLGQFPRTGGESVGFGHQRANRAQIDDIALHVRIKRFAQIGCDLRIFATTCLAHLVNARDFRREAHAARARNTAGHVGLDKWTEIQIVRGTLWLAEAGEVDAICHRLILQIALTALVANRAIERMVNQEELHDTFAGLFNHRGIGLHDRRLALRTRAQIADLHRAGGGWLWRAAHNFDQTHAAVASNCKAFVVTETGDFDARHFAGLNEGHRPINFDLGSINDDFFQIRHGAPLCSFDPCA